MNSPLLQSSEKCFEFRSIFNSNSSFNDDVNLLENSAEENSLLFPIPNGLNNVNESYEELSQFCIPNSEPKNNFNLLNEELLEKKEETYSQFNSINENRMNLSPLSLLTTSNSFSFANIGVKSEENLLETQKDIKDNNNKTEEKIFKCDFLEEISLGLDEDAYNYNTKNKKNKLDLNDPTSLFAAIVNLMKEKGPIEIRYIISNLESKKDLFRKANGSRYKQEFGKLIRTTLNNNPELFFKEKEGNKYYFIENKTKYYLQKKRYEEIINEQDFMGEMDNFDLNSLFTFGINFDMLKLIINNLIKANHRLNCKLSELKMDKINSLYELTILNQKIIDICFTLEKIEKGELFFKTEDNIIENVSNEYNDKNSRNIMFVEGANNTFNEPPDKI